jgi:hypothetical protein
MMSIKCLANHSIPISTQISQYSDQITAYIKNKNFNDFFVFFRTDNFFFKNDPIRANFMRGIDRIPEASLIQGNVCIEAKLENF